MTPLAPAPATEYDRATTAAVWRERAARGAITLTGADAAEFLQGQVTNDVEALTPGTGCYALLLNQKGKLRADMRILCPAADTLTVESSRAALEVLLATIESRRVGFAFEMTDAGDDVALVSLLGPATADNLAALLDDGEPPAAAEHANTLVRLTGEPALAVRTDLGVDLLVSGDRARCERVHGALAERLGEAVGPETVETLRVESGRPLLGRELDGDTMPQEADLNDRAVDFEKGCYVGQETVARLYYKGKPTRHLRGLVLSAPAEHGEPVVAADARELGVVGTAVQSPAHGPIALALLRREGDIGDQVTIGDGKAATIVEPGHFE